MFLILSSRLNFIFFFFRSCTYVTDELGGRPGGFGRNTGVGVPRVLKYHKHGINWLKGCPYMGSIGPPPPPPGSVLSYVFDAMLGHDDSF